MGKYPIYINIDILKLKDPILFYVSLYPAKTFQLVTEYLMW